MSGVVALTGGALADLDAAREIAGAHAVQPLTEVEDTTQIAALLGASPQDDLTAFPGLRWVHSGAAGVDAWLGGDRFPDGVELTSAVGNGAIPLAEHALMLLLMLNRDAVRWTRAQDEHRWERRVHGELAGRTLGIIGYGNSGRDLALKALSCHMEVMALRRKDLGPEDGQVAMLHGDEGLHELLASSDYVVVTAPLTPETHGMIGAAELARMRPGAAIVVISRGGIVDEDALVDALREGRLSGAGLDALAVEPLPTDSPLWDLPGVIVTPHNAATTTATAARGREIMLENLRRWASGRTLVNVVDRRHGY